MRNGFGNLVNAYYAAVGDSVRQCISAAPISAPRLLPFAPSRHSSNLCFPYYKRVNDWIHTHTAVENLQAFLRRGLKIHSVVH